MSSAAYVPVWEGSFGPYRAFEGPSYWRDRWESLPRGSYILDTVAEAVRPYYERMGGPRFSYFPGNDAGGRYLPDYDKFVIASSLRYNHLSKAKIILHELAHSTGHATRLNREVIVNSWRHYYGINRAYEEVLAESVAVEILNILCLPVCRGYKVPLYTNYGPLEYIEHWADRMNNRYLEVIEMEMKDVIKALLTGEK